MFIALVIAGFFLLLTRDTVLGDHDTYMHIRIGEVILQTYSIPDMDLFSYGRAGQPWAAHEWLSDVILYLVSWGLGWTGLVVLVVLCVLSTVAFVWQYSAERLPVPYALAVSFFTLFSLFGHVLARPHVLTWPLFSGWCYGLFTSYERKKSPNYFLLLIPILWVNLHGGFVLLFVILIPLVMQIAVETCHKKIHPSVLKLWVVFALSSFLMTLCNPRGIAAYSFLFDLLSTQNLASVNEWRPVEWSDPTCAQLWLGITVVLMLTGLVRLPVIFWLVVVGFFYEAFSHIRYVSLLGVFLPYVLAHPFAIGYQQFNQQRSSGIFAHTTTPEFDNFLTRSCFHTMRGAIYIVTIVLIVIGLVAHYLALNSPGNRVMPKLAVDRIVDLGMSGPGLNSYGFGGYLIYRHIPVFIDGRVDFYGSDHLKAYDTIMNSSSNGEVTEMVSEYGFCWMILTLDKPLVKVMRHLEGWVQLHEDPDAVVFVRSACIKQETND